MKEKKRILLVDDEPDLCEILRFNLEATGYQTEAAYSGETAIEKIANCKSTNCKGFDLLLLDVMMPGMSGFELAERLKAEETNIPIIFLTAKDTEDDILEGFRQGADDYIAKPFSVREVLARVKAVLSRTDADTKAPHPQEISYKGLVMQQERKSVTVNGREVSFTRTEFDLLWTLLANRGTVLTRQELLRRAWPSDGVVTDRTVDGNITRIRKKIEPYATCITTRLGFGYCFCL